MQNDFNHCQEFFLGWLEVVCGSLADPWAVWVVCVDSGHICFSSIFDMLDSDLTNSTTKRTVCVGGLMDRTNAEQFRSNMKEWMEAAHSEPVKITRKSGESFVLLNADIFEKMQLDLARLEGLTASLIDVAKGRVSAATEKSTTDLFSRAKQKALAGKKTKKAVG